MTTADVENRRDRRERVGIVRRLRRGWRETWREYFSEEWGFAVFRHRCKERRPHSPFFWAANGWNGDGGEMWIGRLEVVTDWPMPWAAYGPEDYPAWLQGDAA